MQSAATVLEVLRERGRKGLPCDELYRQMFNRDLYLAAYGNVYSNKGAMTPGADGVTADGMSESEIDRVIGLMRQEKYRFCPARRVYIPKKNGKLRPLGLPSYDFLANNALAVVIVANVWKGTAWSYLLFSAALDSISREILEAARVDGATGLQRVWMVILPIIRPHIATNMLFITIWTFTYFPLIYAMTGGGPGRQTQVLAILMYEQSFKVGKIGYGSAISVAMLAVVGLLSIFYVRLLREPK